MEKRRRRSEKRKIGKNKIKAKAHPALYLGREEKPFPNSLLYVYAVFISTDFWLVVLNIIPIEIFRTICNLYDFRPKPSFNVSNRQ